MKFRSDNANADIIWSHPAWGAWIEILRVAGMASLKSSHPAWGAWIEIQRVCAIPSWSSVAPRMGCVD